ncbi:MAG: T9SS type A sorting domain-containing protein [bacterium]
MRKIYILAVFLMASALVSGQVYLAEDFSGGNMPPPGWEIDNMENQWSVSATNSAGGTAPEAKFTWYNTVQTTRLISPETDLTGGSDLKVKFAHFLDNYGGGSYSIGMAVRTGGGEWDVLWEVAPNSNIGPELNYVDIPASYEGATDFQICFFLDGNLYNLDFWFIDDIEVLTPNALDLSLTSVMLPSFVAIDDEFEITGHVLNVGTDAITSYDVSYTVDGGDQQTTSVSGISLAIGESDAFTCSPSISFGEEGSHDIEVMIHNINGGDDDNDENNMLSAMVSVVPFIPEKKVLGEEATGTWCPWCTRGTCYMDMMYETYPDTWIGIAVHNSDPMEVPEYDAAMPSIVPNFPGYPSGTVDRSGTDYYDPSEFEEGYLERINAISPATCEITNFSFNWDTRVVTFDVESEFVADVDKELRFMAIILEDSLSGTSSDWAQANAYAGGGNGPMCGYEDMPNPIPASEMKYDHVARAILDTPYGTEGSLPATISAGETHSYTYTYTIPEDWDFYWMQFVGVLLDGETGEVLNCNVYPEEVTSVEEPQVVANIKVYPNPTQGIVSVSGADNATIMVYNIAGNLVASYEDFRNSTIDLSGYNSGIYLFWIKTDDGIVTKRIILE